MIKKSIKDKYLREEKIKTFREDYLISKFSFVLFEVVN